MNTFVFNVTEAIDTSSGTKAEELLRLKNIGVNVPQFWTVKYEEYVRFIQTFSIMSIEEFLKKEKYDAAEVKKIQAVKKNLSTTLNISNEKQLIARSSSVPKKRTMCYASIISGAFESYECTTTTLAESIVDVYESMYSEKAFLQLKLARLQEGIKGMAILIQEFIEPECSGVLHVYINKPYWEINWVKGHLRAIVAGDTSGDYDQIYENAGDIILKGKECNIYCVMENEWYEAFSDLYYTAKFIYDHTNKNLEIEWIYKDNKIFIVQCQELIDL